MVLMKLSGRIIGGRGTNGNATGILSTHDLLGLPVINGVGESLGQIDEILLDVAGGRVAYAVLELSGLLGASEKLFAVPWLALTLDADNRCFILSIDKRRLQDAPCFERSCWSMLADSDWADAVHRFYSAEPFWRYHA
jgi:hypothetical protein